MLETDWAVKVGSGFVLKFWKEYLDSSNLPLIDAKTQ